MSSVRFTKKETSFTHSCKQYLLRCVNIFIIRAKKKMSPAVVLVLTECTHLDIQIMTRPTAGDKMCSTVDSHSLETVAPSVDVHVANSECTVHVTNMCTCILRLKCPALGSPERKLYLLTHVNTIYCGV